MKKTEQLTLQLPANPEYIPIATFSAKRCAESVGFPDGDIGRISLAMEEAFAHALEFGYGGDAETLQISIFRTALGISLAIKFHGLPLKIDQLPKYDPSRAMAHGDVTGISLMLIEKMLDRTSFSTDSGGYRKVSMEKFLPAKIVEETNIPQRSKTSSSLECTLRLARPEDAEPISRLAFQSHGNVLFSEHIYYPERVCEMISEEEMVSVVFETNDTHEMVAHGALLKSAPGAQVEELTFGIVSPKFRSQGGATAMADFLEKNAVDRGVYAIEVFAVTSHVHSQRSVLSNNFMESGLLVDTSPASHSWGDHKDDKMRIGNVIYTKRLKEFEVKELHIPEQHKQIVERIYAAHSLKIKIDYTPDKEPELEEVTKLWSTTDFVEGWSMIGIESYGKDVLAQVSDRLRHACSQGISAIQMALPLEDPATPMMAGRFEEMGFFFAGVCPVHDCHENLILQYINEPFTDYESIHVHSDLAHEIKQYVMACDPRSSDQGPPK